MKWTSSHCSVQRNGWTPFALFLLVRGVDLWKWNWDWLWGYFLIKVHHFHNPSRQREHILLTKLSATSQRLRISGRKRNSLEAGEQKKRQRIDTKMGRQRGRGASQWRTAQLLVWIRIFCFFFPIFRGRTGTTVYAVRALSNIPFLLTGKNLGLLSKLFYRGLYAGRLPKCKWVNTTV